MARLVIITLIAFFITERSMSGLPWRDDMERKVNDLRNDLGKLARELNARMNTG